MDYSPTAIDYLTYYAWAIIIASWVLSILASVWLGDTKGRVGAGFLVGLCFGALGPVIIGLAPKTPEQAAEDQVQVEKHLQKFRKK